jgi:hypothetical protein
MDDNTHTNAHTVVDNYFTIHQMTLAKRIRVEIRIKKTSDDRHHHTARPTRTTFNGTASNPTKQNKTKQNKTKQNKITHSITTAKLQHTKAKDNTKQGTRPANIAVCWACPDEKQSQPTQATARK